MKEYHKINSVFKRDDKGKFTNEFSKPEFEYLFKSEWIGTEKIDGTNIRIHYEKGSNRILIGGRTDNAQIPVFLFEKLQQIFTYDKFLNSFPNSDCMTLYGEGYGAKIQKGGGNYIKDGVDFILFDVMIGDIFLQRKDIELIALSLNIKVVPIIFEGTLQEAVEQTKLGFYSTFGLFPAEGYVLKPKVELQDRRGNRIITKLKLKDFKS